MTPTSDAPIVLNGLAAIREATGHSKLGWLGAKSIAARVVRAPNHDAPGQRFAQATVPWAFGGKQSVGVRARRVAFGGGVISLRVVVVEPADELFSPPSGMELCWVRPERIRLRQPIGTVVLMHGLWCSVEMTAPHAACLANAGFRCILLDLRGHGESSGTTVSFGKHEVEDLREVLHVLRADGTVQGPLALFGLSMGAVTALMAAGRGVTAHAIVAVASFARLRDVAPNFSREFVGWLARFVSSRFIDRVIAHAGELADFDPDADCPLALAPLIRMPVLLVHSARDTLVPAQESLRIAAALGGPQRCVVLPGADHITEVLDPGRSLPTVLPWLEQVLTPQAFRVLGGPWVGWMGEAAADFAASWAWRNRAADHLVRRLPAAGTCQVRTWVGIPAAWLGRDLALLTDGTVAIERIQIDGISSATGSLPGLWRIPGWMVAGTTLELTLRIARPPSGIPWTGSGVMVLRPA